MVAPEGLPVVEPLEELDELLEVEPFSSVGSSSCDEPLLDEDEPLFDEPLLPEDEDEEDVVPVSEPPEHATIEASEKTKPAARRCLRAFMAALECERRAMRDPSGFSGSWRKRRPRVAPGWRKRCHMLKGSGMNSSTNIASVRMATALRLPSSGSAPVDG